MTLATIKLLIIKHWVALIMALLVGVITIGPQWYFIWAHQDSYQGIYMLHSDAEPHYLARMREAVDGQGIGNPFLVGFKVGIPIATPTVIEQVASWPALVFNLSVTRLNLIYKFILPGLIFLLIYFLSYRLTRSIVWSLAGGILIILGYPLLDFGNLLNLIKSELVFTQFLMYARPINPQISGLFFFSFLHLLLSYWRQGFNWRCGGLLAMILGVSFYIYFYLFTYLLALLVIALIILGIIKRWRDAWGLVGVLILGTVVGLPIVYELFKVITHSDYYLLAETFNLQIGRGPVLSSVFLVTSLMFILSLWWFRHYYDRWPTETLFITVLLTTSLVVVNQQLITGIVLQEGHYHWYFNRPIFTIILIWSGWSILRNSHFWSKIITILIMVVSIYAGCFVQYSSYLARVAETVSLQKYGPILKWIETNTESEAVFLANQALSELIPVYTGGNVVWEDHASYYLMSKERRKFTVKNILEGKVDPKAYQINYIVWDRVKDQDWPVNRFFKLKLLFDSEQIGIYEVLS